MAKNWWNSLFLGTNRMGPTCNGGVTSSAGTNFLTRTINTMGGKGLFLKMATSVKRPITVQASWMGFKGSGMKTGNLFLITPLGTTNYMALSAFKVVFQMG